MTTSPQGTAGVPPVPDPKHIAALYDDLRIAVLKAGDAICRGMDVLAIDRCVFTSGEYLERQLCFAAAFVDDALATYRRYDAELTELQAVARAGVTVNADVPTDEDRDEVLEPTPLVGLHVPAINTLPDELTDPRKNAMLAALQDEGGEG